MTKFIKLAQLRSIALAADVVCDVAQAIRNSIEAHQGHGDGHLVSVPESISCLIGLAEPEVTAVLVPSSLGISPGVDSVPAAPEISEPAPEVSPAAPEVSDAPLTPDPVG